MKISTNVDGVSIHDFDNESVLRMARAPDDSPMWAGYPYTAQHKITWRAIARFVLEERAAGRLKEGKKRAQ